MAKKKKGKDYWTQLAEAAEECNKVMGLAPPIKTDNVSEIELEEKLREAASMKEEGDEFSKDTEYIFRKVTEGAETVAEEETEVEVEAQDEPDVEEVTLEEIREEVEALKSRKELRLYITDFPDLFEPVIGALPDLETAGDLKEAILDHLTFIENAEEEEIDEEDQKKKAKQTKEKAKGKKKPSQTAIIREGFNDELDEEGIISQLCEIFEKKKSWAKSRITTYERAYGKAGKNDDKVQNS